MLCLCFKFNLPFCLFGHTTDTSIIYEKGKFVCFIDMQPQNVKFTSAEVNVHIFFYIFFSISFILQHTESEFFSKYQTQHVLLIIS